jgi:alpha-ketoglutarate-dependent 2,4-dichlorophenoxyacetate dioxygenase
MWDTRPTLPRARRYYSAARRALRRTTINDTPEARLAAA